jgi:hypothetical protein
MIVGASGSGGKQGDRLSNNVSAVVAFQEGRRQVVYGV